MQYEYDVLVIGLGPAGMAVSVMAAEMSLRVCAIEKDRVGGECMNVGCIPSKALLRIAKKQHILDSLAPDSPNLPRSALADPFGWIGERLAYIADHKTMGMFAKVDLCIGQGAATFCGPHEVLVGERRISAKRIFICTGTKPAIPDIPGLRDIGPLTNETLFHLQAVPSRMVVLGSGAIACEMAQAFARLGCRVTMVFRGKGLLWREDGAVGALLEQRFMQEGIVLEKNAVMHSFEKGADGIRLTLGNGTILEADTVLCALGRHFDPSPCILTRPVLSATPKASLWTDFCVPRKNISMPAAIITASISFRTLPCIRVCRP